MPGNAHIRARCQRPLALAETRGRQCELGEWFPEATKSRPDIRALFAQRGAKVNPQGVRDYCSMVELGETAVLRQPQTA